MPLACLRHAWGTRRHGGLGLLRARASVGCALTVFDGSVSGTCLRRACSVPVNGQGTVVNGAGQCEARARHASSSQSLWTGVSSARRAFKLIIFLAGASSAQSNVNSTCRSANVAIGYLYLWQRSQEEVKNVCSIYRAEAPLAQEWLCCTFVYWQSLLGRVVWRARYIEMRCVDSFIRLRSACCDDEV